MTTPSRKVRRRAAFIGASVAAVAAVSTLLSGGAHLVSTAVIYNSRFGVGDGGTYTVAAGRYDGLGRGEFTDKPSTPGFIHIAYPKTNPLRGKKIIDVKKAARENVTGDHIALADTGEVFAWGRNVDGMVGNGTTTPVDRAQRLDFTGTAAESSKVVQIATTLTTAYALTADNHVVSWGRNDHGLLGRGIADTTAVSRPGDVDQSSIGRIRGVHTIGAAVLLTDDVGAIWGFGEATALRGTYKKDEWLAESVTTPERVEVLGLDGLEIVRSAGNATRFTNDDRWWRSNLVLLSDGRILSWGIDHSGENAGGFVENVVPKPRPIVVAGGEQDVRFKDLALGDRNAMALTNDGDVFTWGINNEFQLGYDSNNTNIGEARPLDGFPDEVVRIVAGNSHDLALLANGALMAWGANSDGQLAALEPFPWERPTPLKPLVNGTITDVIAGVNHTMLTVDTNGTKPERLPALGRNAPQPPSSPESPADEDPSGDLHHKLAFATGSVEAVDGRLPLLTGTGRAGTTVTVHAARAQSGLEMGGTDEASASPHAEASLTPAPIPSLHPGAEPDGSVEPDGLIGTATVADDGTWSIAAGKHIAADVIRLTAEDDSSSVHAVVPVRHKAADDPDMAQDDAPSGNDVERPIAEPTALPSAARPTPGTSGAPGVSTKQTAH